jgi:hypothetical protein
MLKPIEKPTTRTLVHHPSEVLDAFCNYDSANQPWVKFDQSVSCQLIELEFKNRRHIRPRQDSRRSSL